MGSVFFFFFTSAHALLGEELFGGYLQQESWSPQLLVDKG
jgi:hypothetical protein